MLNKNILFCYFLVFSSFFAFSQEKIRYGSIPYGITLEQAIERYTSLYDRVSHFNEPNRSITISSLNFTAIRPFFIDVYGEVPTRPDNFLSRSYTELLRLTENINGENITTNLYFIKKNNTTKLFMVSRPASGNRNDSAQVRHDNNKIAVSEVLNIRARDLSGNYEYYFNGYYSTAGLVSIWETNDERIFLHTTRSGINTFSEFLHISKTLWNEYAQIFVDERNRSRQDARSAF